MHDLKAKNEQEMDAVSKWEESNVMLQKKQLEYTERLAELQVCRSVYE